MSLEHRIESAVARQFGLRPADLHERTRRQPVAMARMLAIFMLRSHHRERDYVSLWFGLCPSSINYATRRVRELLSVDREVAAWHQAAERAL